MVDMAMTATIRGLLAALLIAGISGLIYSINLERPPHHDELYHMLAARGVLATGEPSIGEEGRYWRGYALTWLVAQSVAAFGDTMTAGRLPAVIGMVLLVALLFTFLRREAGAPAAWIGAGLFAVSPFAIELGQFVRFFSLQCLAFFAGAWLVYAALRAPWSLRRILVMAAPAVAALAIAVYFQPTSLFGIVGLGLWGSAALLLPWLHDAGTAPSRKRQALLLLFAVGVLSLAAIVFSGLYQLLWSDYRTTSLFNEATVNHFWFYHVWLVLYYPTLWTLSGIIVIFAFIKNPRLTLFLLSIFVIGFILNSFAARKSMRYIAYALPFLFALWGVGLAYLLSHGVGLAGWLRERVADRFTLLKGGTARFAARALLVLGVLFVVLANPAWLRSVTLLASITVPPELPPTRWDLAAPVLGPVVETTDAVVTTSELGMLYYYGRADYVLSANKFHELPAERRRPFGRDVRTDLPVIVEPADLERVMNCHPTGVVVMLAEHWLDGGRILPAVAATADLVMARTRPLELPPRSRIRAFVWDNQGQHDNCADLPPPRARTMD
jgi:hypothetical protein